MTRTGATTIEPAQLRRLVETNTHVRLIDVRGPGEFAASHIEGSHNVPLDMLRKHPGLSATHTDPVVLICASGARAEQAHAMLDNAGLTDLSVLREGLTAWERAGHPLREGSGTWAMERQVRLTAGSLVLVGALGSIRYRRMTALAGLIGAGLTFSAITNTCGMARVLSKLPHNRAGNPDPSSALAAVIEPLP